jgi:hypothetical protein
MHAPVHPADIQDRDGGVLVMANCSASTRFCSSSSPTAAIRDRPFQDGLRKVCRTITVEIVRRSN